MAPAARAPIITLLTDFGTADGYVAEIKGVLYTAIPDVIVVDVSHDVPPHDVEFARLTLARYWQRFPADAIHLVVVDPGVGSPRAAIAAQSEGRFLLGPDNGALSPALLMPGAQVIQLPVPAGAAPTFHGRDVFAPAAAALAGATPFLSLGTPLLHPVIRRTPEPVRDPDGTLHGMIIAIDRFGNAVTNFAGPRGGAVSVAGRSVPVHRTYSDGAPGGLVALVGSSGLLEIAQRDGSAAERLGLHRGDEVLWTA